MTKGYGRYCSAINCHNCKGRNPEKSFFSFPNNPERCKRWVINTRRQDLLARDINYLSKNCCICSDHFEPNFFLNDLRNRLKPDAIPTIFKVPNPPNLLSTKRRKITRKENEILLSEEDNVNMEVDKATSIEPAVCQSSPSSSSPPSNTELTVAQSAQTEQFLSLHSPRKQQMRKNIRRLIIKNSNLKKQIMRAKLQRKSKTNVISKSELINAAEKYLPKTFFKFFESQIELFEKKTNGRRYKSDSKMFFFSLYFCSPRAYTFLSKIFAFPHFSTLARWLKCYCNTGPEILEQLLATLKLKVDAMSELDKLCTVCLDEISLKPCLTYDRKTDQIIGFEDLGHNSRTQCIANNAVVFMVHGITTKWKQPLGYIFTRGPCKKKHLQTILLCILEKLREIGLIVKAVISDQGSNFLQLFHHLGVTENKNYFHHNQNKYFVIFDPPHLLKSIRNNIFKYNVEFDDKTASWDDITQLFMLDSKKMYRCIPKLTEKHIFLPSFSKMKVSLAAQVLSHSVAAAIETYVTFNALSNIALGTAEFCHKFDEIFDCLNSSSLHGPKLLRRAMTTTSPHELTIKKFIIWLNNCRFIDKISGNNVTGRIKCLTGWKITLKSIMEIWSDLNLNYNVQSLNTRQFNQDCLENFFSSVRSSNGCNVNPTIQQFCRVFKQISFNLLLTTSKSKSNCLLDEDEILLNKVTEICENEVRKDQSIITETLNSVTNFLPSISSNLQEMPLVVENAFQYICGFLLKKMFAIHKCSQCSFFGETVTLENKQMFMYFKQFDNCNLLAANEDFVTFIKKLEKIFIEIFEQYAHKKKIGAILYENMMHVSLPVSCMPKEFIIKYFIRVRIYYCLKFFNKTKTKNVNSKFHILID